jgi:hypothetical protein
MRLEGGHYRCALCGADLAFPTTARPQVVIEAASGKPNVRVLSLDGREIHRCDGAPTARATAHPLRPAH